MAFIAKNRQNTLLMKNIFRFSFSQIYYHSIVCRYHYMFLEMLAISLQLSDVIKWSFYCFTFFASMLIDTYTIMYNFIPI